jgi:AraC family transcriptional regulator
MHLGGAKRVRRWRDSRLDVFDVPLGALTLMPAYQSNRWLTEGPVDFVHILLSPDLVRRVALEEFGTDTASCSLVDAVGFRDAYLESIFAALLSAVEGRTPTGRLYPDSLLIVMVATLLNRYSNVSAEGAARLVSRETTRGGLTPARLRRVHDYMMVNIASDIGLAELTAQTGLSRAQFFRAFKQTTGVTPYRYLTALRLDAAKDMLICRDLDIANVASMVGLPVATRFSSLFRKRFGTSPRAYMRASRISRDG